MCVLMDDPVKVFPTEDKSYKRSRSNFFIGEILEIFLERSGTFLRKIAGFQFVAFQKTDFFTLYAFDGFFSTFQNRFLSEHLNTVKPPKQRTCHEQGTKSSVPNVTIFLKLLPNRGHLSIMGKFPKTRSCPLFRGFTVYLRPYTVATHGNRRRVFQKKNYFNEKKFGEIKVINIKFKNLN